MTGIVLFFILFLGGGTRQVGTRDVWESRVVCVGSHKMIKFFRTDTGDGE